MDTVSPVIYGPSLTCRHTGSKEGNLRAWQGWTGTCLGHLPPQTRTKSPLNVPQAPCLPPQDHLDPTPTLLFNGQSHHPYLGGERSTHRRRGVGWGRGWGHTGRLGVLCATTQPLKLIANLFLILPFSSLLHRARSGARRWQRSVPGGCRLLPLGHPPRAPPPRLLIRERRVPGGPAAPLPRRGLSPPRRPGTPLHRTGDAPEDVRRRRASEDGRISPCARIVLAAGYAVQIPPRATRLSPATITPGDAAQHGQGSLRPPHPRGGGGRGALGEAAAQSCRRGCPSCHLAKPPMPKKTPKVEAPWLCLQPSRS